MSEDRPRGAVATVPGGVAVALKVTPKAAKDEVRGVVADAYGRARVKVSVTAAPADGKANAAVIALLARIWRVPKSALTITAGAAARDKIVHVAAPPDVAAALAAWAQDLERSTRNR